MSSASGTARLFVDNFNGSRNMAYDIGCPRIASFDDPFPDPNCGVIASNPNTYIVANGMSYQGCYDDQTGGLRALNFQAYTSSNNTVEMCTSACAGANYTIAGVEFGTGMFDSVSCHSKC